MFVVPLVAVHKVAKDFRAPLVAMQIYKLQRKVHIEAHSLRNRFFTNGPLVRHLDAVPHAF